jgi:hypothetical protein
MFPLPLAGEGWGGGPCFNRSGNRFEHASPIGHHIVIAEAQNAKSFGFDSRTASGVGRLLAIGEMLPTIKLDR